MHDTSSTHHTVVDSLTARVGPRASGLIKGIGLGVLTGVLVLVLIVGFVNLLETHSTLNDVRNVQANHANTLSRIDRVDQRLKSEISKLNAATATVDHILQEAGQVSTKLLAQQAALCAAVPGCHLP